MGCASGSSSMADGIVGGVEDGVPHAHRSEGLKASLAVLSQVAID